MFEELREARPGSKGKGADKAGDQTGPGATLEGQFFNSVSFPEHLKQKLPNVFYGHHDWTLNPSCLTLSPLTVAICGGDMPSALSFLLRYAKCISA